VAVVVVVAAVVLQPVRRALVVLPVAAEAEAVVVEVDAVEQRGVEQMHTMK
jgi:hypothetical protein